MDITVNGLRERNEGAKQLTNGHAINDASYKQFNEKLEQITRFLLKELEDKQRTIEEQRTEIERSKVEILDKTALITDLEEKLKNCAQHTEGHRQLINKL